MQRRESFTSRHSRAICLNLRQFQLIHLNLNEFEWSSEEFSQAEPIALLDGDPWLTKQLFPVLLRTGTTIYYQ